jgi:hypothetical protein
MLSLFDTLDNLLLDRVRRAGVRLPRLSPLRARADRAGSRIPSMNLSAFSSD